MSTVAVVTSEPADEAWVRRALEGALELVEAAAVEAAARADVIVAGADRLAALADLAPAGAPIVVLGDPADPPPRAAHVITRAWPDAALRALLTALAAGAPHAEPPLPAPSSPAEARDAQRAISAARKLASATDLAACEAAIVETLIELVDVDRAYCLYGDPAEGSLWSEARLAATGADDRRAAAGLAGFAARTGLAALAPAAGDDPRFVGAIDDPDGDPADRLIAQPVFGSDGAIHAVLICARRARRPAFGAPEAALLGRLARLVTPILDQLSIALHAQAILDDADGGGGLFRREAAAARDAPRWGDVVRVSPGWLSWAYRLLVVLLVASAVFAVAGTVSTYSTGPAVIRSKARTPVTARTAGNVIAVEVSPGELARPGQVIARLDDADQRAAVERLGRELEIQLRNHMLDPADAAADAALRGVRHDLELARAALGERLIVAPSAGIVGDIRVRAGQRVAPGDFVASILDRAQGFEVVALLPGEDRPQLAPGMTIRLELIGYRYAYQAVVIDAVSPDVIAPNEARRVLGAEVADGLALGGPVVLVRGRLAREAFEVDGRTFRYHDGMLGTAEVRVRSEPIVFALIPGTRRFQ